MHTIQSNYTTYFNNKRSRSGHLFLWRYKSIGHYCINEAGNAAPNNYEVEILVWRHSRNEKARRVMRDPDQ
jgi:hypothetical protein